MEKEQEIIKRNETLLDEVKKSIAELEAKGINPEEYIASRPMGKFVASNDTTWTTTK